MIRAAWTDRSATLMPELARRAGELARARAEDAARERHGDPWRWRDAAMLWPRFTGRN